MFSLSFVFPCFICFTRGLNSRKLNNNSGVSVNRARTIPLSCVCVCVLYSVFSLIPLYSCSLSISYLVYVIFCLFQKEAPCGRVLTCATPPPPHTHTQTPSPFFFPCFPFLLSPPSFSNFLTFFSTDSSISGSGLWFFFIFVFLFLC